MADNEKVTEETAPRGSDWEVVTLTESAYAAAPGPSGPGKTNDGDAGKNESGSSGKMVMSDHFVFPPSEHENLPIEPVEPESSEILVEKEGEEVEDDDTSGADAIVRSLKGKTDVDANAVQFFDQGKSLPVRDLEDSEFDQLLAEDYGHDDDNGDEVPRDNFECSEEEEEEEEEEEAFPHKAWWKKRASCLYNQAKQANAFWSVVVAAALVGLVILGHRWHREKLQHRQLKWHSSSAVRG